MIEYLAIGFGATSFLQGLILLSRSTKKKKRPAPAGNWDLA